MIPNLHDYAKKSQKIPSQILENKKNPMVFKMWALMAAHFFDFIAIFYTTMMMSATYKFAANQVMVTGSMKSVLSDVNISSLGMSLLPLVALSYYFFCYFFNEGQSVGMRLMRTRLPKTNLNIQPSLIWAVRSTTIIFSMGITAFFLKKQFANSLQVHDHLYHAMIVEKDWAAPNLLSRIDEHAKEVVSYQRAA
jgi:hypothetical protein